MPSSEPSFSAFRERLLSETVKERLLSETDDVADLGAPAGLGSRANSFIVRTKENSTFRPLTAGGVRQSILVLVQTSLGGGILTMGYMMKLAGLANGLLFLLLAAFVAAASMEVLMKSAVMLHRYTLGSLLGYVFGKKSGVLLDMMLFIYGNGTLILYFVFLGDFIPNIFQAVMGGADSPPAEQEKLRTYCVVAAMCTVMPVSLFRDLSMLRVLSPVMVIGIVYTELVVLIKCFTSERSHVEIREVEWSFFPNLQAFSLCVFGYVCHMNVTPVAKELESPSDRRIEKVTFRVVVVQFIIYTLLAVGGYLTFGEGTLPNLLQNYPADDWAVLGSRVMLTLTILVAVATNTNPTVRALLCLLEMVFPEMQEEEPQGMAEPTTTPVLKRPAEEPPLRRRLRYVLSITCLLVDTVVALKVQDVAAVVGLLGATMGTIMMMVIPALLLLNVEKPLFNRGFQIFLSAVFIVSALFNLLASFAV